VRYLFGQSPLLAEALSWVPVEAVRGSIDVGVSCDCAADAKLMGPVHPIAPVDSWLASRESLGLCGPHRHV
jgi:hypothetical protein